jgi:hypothetical protein
VPYELARIKYERITRAVLENIQVWIDRVAEAEATASPGNRHRLLSLQRDMMMCKISLERLAKDAELKR